MMTHPRGIHRLDPLRVSGGKPPIVVSVVSSMGAKRVSPASVTASTTVVKE